MRCDTHRGYGVLGMGMYLPARIVDNTEIAAPSGTTPDWVLARTGVEVRHRAAPDEHTADLAAAAAAAALADADRHGATTAPELLIAATATPDRQVPAPVYDVHGRLNLPPMPTLSLDGACAGFAQAVITGWCWFRAGVAHTALVVAANRAANYIDPTDRRIAPLFGDGAGAFLLGPVPAGYGLLGFEMSTDSAGAELLRTPPHSSEPGDRQYLSMNGPALARAIATDLPRLLHRALDRAGLTVADIDRLLMHQANVRMVEAFAAALGLPPERVPTSGRRVANTAAASLPIGVALAAADRPIQRGEIVVLATAGAGVSGAVLVLRWY